MIVVLEEQKSVLVIVSFFYVPSVKTGRAHKFAQPFHGPYRVLEVKSNDAWIVPVVCLISWCTNNVQ